MKFTQDWFSHNISGIQGLYKNREKPMNILEIGCFEGRATCWFLQNLLPEHGEIVCIDTFMGGLEHEKMDFSGTREAFTNNTNEAKRPSQNVELLDCESYVGLSNLISEKRKFDLIYVDGSHTASDVLSDACMSYHLCDKGGIILFDDYLWQPEAHPLITPKMAIDQFALMFHGRVALRMIGIQMAYEKL